MAVKSSFCVSQNCILCPDLTHRKPSHAHDDVQPPLLPAGVLERPHAVAVDVPEGARGRVHPALADVGDGSVALLVEDALLHDGAVDGEAVGRGSGGGGGLGGGDEGFEDVVLKYCVTKGGGFVSYQSGFSFSFSIGGGGKFCGESSVPPSSWGFVGACWFVLWRVSTYNDQ